MISMTARHQNYDGLGIIEALHVILSMTSLIYHIPRQQRSAKDDRQHGPKRRAGGDADQGGVGRIESVDAAEGDGGIEASA